MVLDMFSAAVKVFINLMHGRRGDNSCHLTFDERLTWTRLRWRKLGGKPSELCENTADIPQVWFVLQWSCDRILET